MYTFGNMKCNSYALLDSSSAPEFFKSLKIFTKISNLLTVYTGITKISWSVKKEDP